MNFRPAWSAFKSLPSLVQIGAPVALVLGAYIGVLRHRNEVLTQQFIVETLRANNEVAHGDTTRRVILAKNDTLAAWEKLAVQEKQRGDQLEKQLKRELKLKAALQIRVDSLVAELHGTPVTEDSAGTRHATFSTYKTPYTVHATVDLPKPPAPGVMQIGIRMDTLQIGVRAQCGKADAHGVREAAVVVTGPEWAPIQLAAVTQDPGVCMPQLVVKQKKSHFTLGAALGAAATVLLHIFKVF